MVVAVLNPAVEQPSTAYVAVVKAKVQIRENRRFLRKIFKALVPPRRFDEDDLSSGFEFAGSASGPAKCIKDSVEVELVRVQQPQLRMSAASSRFSQDGRLTVCADARVWMCRVSQRITHTQKSQLEDLEEFSA